MPESNIRYDACLEQQADWAPSLEIGTWGSKPWGNLIEWPIPQWKDYGVKPLDIVFTSGTTATFIPPKGDYTSILVNGIRMQLQESYTLQEGEYTIICYM